MRIFDKYSLYYNAMYKDKDYNKETNYVDEIIQAYQPSTKRILDLGCGTGQHAQLLAKKGYHVLGVDISKTMIDEARKSTSNPNLRFTLGDIKSIQLDESFDVIISLFHVISYQTSNDDLLKSFSTVYNHLKKGGLFIFDCWYGPGVLTEKPTTRIKNVENNGYKIIRYTEPVIHSNENIVEVKFQFLVLDQKNRIVEEFNETHFMRYLFKPELEFILNECGFKILKFAEFLTDKEPDFTTWNACFLTKK